MLVERLTKTGFGDYVIKNIAQPLGIETWTWHLAPRPDVAERVMQMSERDQNGT